MFHYWKEHKRGIIVTVIFHLALGGFLIYFGFHTPLPLPSEEALLINFGNNNGGAGLIEPATSPEPSRVTPPPESTPQTKETEAETDILTQDIEEAPAVKTKEVKKEKTDAEKAQEELERKRQEELERKRLEEEAERKRREEEQRKIMEVTQRTQQALSGSQHTSQTTSEGETGEAGNQGDPFGSRESTSHTGSPTGGGDGVSYSLAGRKQVSLPPPEYNYQQAGIVVVEVTVNKEGVVTNAVPGVKGSTTLDEYLLKAAKEAALKARFDRKPDAPAFQKGTITYHFILQ